MTTQTKTTIRNTQAKANKSDKTIPAGACRTNLAATRTLDAFAGRSAAAHRPPPAVRQHAELTTPRRDSGDHCQPHPRQIQWQASSAPGRPRAPCHPSPSPRCRPHSLPHLKTLNKETTACHPSQRQQPKTYGDPWWKRLSNSGTQPQQFPSLSRRKGAAPRRGRAGRNREVGSDAAHHHDPSTVTTATSHTYSIASMAGAQIGGWTAVWIDSRGGSIHSAPSPWISAPFHQSLTTHSMRGMPSMARSCCSLPR